MSTQSENKEEILKDGKDILSSINPTTSTTLILHDNASNIDVVVESVQSPLPSTEERNKEAAADAHKQQHNNSSSELARRRNAYRTRLTKKKAPRENAARKRRDLSDKILFDDETKPTKELEFSIRSLFCRLDSDDSGTLNLEKINMAFQEFGLPSEYAEALNANVMDKEDGLIHFEKFLEFFCDKEKKVKELFLKVDKNNDGVLTINELKDALQNEGINIPLDEVASFVSFVDRDRNGIICYKEWRNFLLLFPLSPNLSNIYHFVSKVSLVDIGESVVIPDGMHVGNMWKYFLVGGVAGATSRTATAPLDRLKVLLQVQSNGKPKYGGVVDGLKTMYRESGLRGYYQGNGINVLKIAPETAVKFFVFEQAKMWVGAYNNNNSDVSWAQRLLAGGIAGMTAQTAIYPMELLKTRIITQAKPKSIFQTTREIWRKEGPATFYRGIGPALLGVMPYAALDLSLFETLKRKYITANDKAPTPLILLGCGTISSSVAVITVYPLALIRTRLQNSSQYNGMVDAFRQIFRNEGLKGFYKGLMPNLMKVIPAASLSYLVYEQGKQMLQIK